MAFKASFEENGNIILALSIAISGLFHNVCDHLITEPFLGYVLYFKTIAVIPFKANFMANFVPSFS